MGAREHRIEAPRTVRAFVLTVSDTRTVDNDESGKLLREILEAAGHVVVNHRIVPDDMEEIRTVVRFEVASSETQAVIITGGTGISPRDVTYEAMNGLLEKELPGFGELFRMLSYSEIGAAAMLSRAIAGVAGTTVIFAIPGSRAAVRLAMHQIILPELGHLVWEVRKGLPSVPPVSGEV